MKKPEILEKLKEIKLELFKLRMARNTITAEEFDNFNNRLEKMVVRLIKELEGVDA